MNSNETPDNSSLSTPKVKIKRTKAQCSDFSDLNQSFGTPPKLIESLESLFGKFDLDVAASESNAKAPEYFTEAEDALNPLSHWKGHSFCNPPFSKSEKFIRKAIIERDVRNVKTTMLLAGRISRIYWDAIYREAAEVLAIRGHIRFQGAPNLASFPVVIVRFVPGMRMGKTIIESGDYQFHRLCGEDSRAEYFPFEVGEFVCNACCYSLDGNEARLVHEVDGEMVDEDGEVFPCPACGGELLDCSESDQQQAA